MQRTKSFKKTCSAASFLGWPLAGNGLALRLGKTPHDPRGPFKGYTCSNSKLSGASLSVGGKLFFACRKTLRTLAREGSIDLRVAERFMTRQFRPALWLLALQSALVCTSTAIGADADTDACRSNLLIIYDAIQAYRQAHQDLPDRLSDLVQDYYLSDLSVLICPAARAQGITSYHVAKWTEAEMFDRGTTYLYEFGTNLIPNIIRGGSGRTMRE